MTIQWQRYRAQFCKFTASFGFCLLTLAAVQIASAAADQPKASDYVQSGLIAQWDGEDNQGTGVHDATATDWVDLTSRHPPMEFATAPTVGEKFYDVSKGGGCIKSCEDIAKAVNAKNATIEIVCDVRTLVNGGTLLSLVDGTGTDAGNRMIWVMNGAGTSTRGVIGTMDYLTNGSTQPYPAFDQTCNEVRSYSFKFGGARCDVYRDGLATSCSKVIGNNGAATLGNAQTACFSIGQRFSQQSASTFISDMNVYSVRIYDRLLTDEELQLNATVDIKRFGMGDSVLNVLGFPKAFGETTPAYGLNFGCIAGQSIEAGAPREIVDESAGVKATCVGYKLYDAWGACVDQGAGNAFTYTHPTPAAYRELVWQWRVDYVFSSENLVSNPSFETAPDGGPTKMSADTKNYGSVSKGDTAAWLGTSAVLCPDAATSSSGNSLWLSTKTVPDGHFGCALQGNSCVSNSFNAAEGLHCYSLTFSRIMRPGAGNVGHILHVAVDSKDNELARFVTTKESSSSWQETKVDFNLAGGVHWLIFWGDTGDKWQDKTTIVDAVKLVREADFSATCGRALSGNGADARVVPSVTDRVSGTVLKEGDDYEVSYCWSQASMVAFIAGKAGSAYESAIPLWIPFEVGDTACLPIPASTAYSQSGVVAQFDGIENVGRGSHDATSRLWKDLSGNGWDFTLCNTRASFGDDCFVMKRGANADSDTAAAYASKGLMAGKYVTIEMAWMPFPGEYPFPTLNVGNVDYGFYSGTGVIQFGSAAASASAKYKWRYDDPNIASGVVTTASCVYFPSEKKGYVNGVAVEPNKTVEGGFVAENTYSTLGGSYSGKGYYAKGAIYSMRFYDRQLSPEEIARHAYVDSIRFKGAAATTNLVVAGTPDLVGDVYPRYGAHTAIDPLDTVCCRAPLEAQRGKRTLRCNGYVLSTNGADGVWHEWKKGRRNQVDYVQPNSSSVKLEWRWTGPGMMLILY